MLSETLTTVRKNLGYKSARAFYNGHLSKNSILDFNYSYYMKIEGGRIVPSPQVISSICKGLEPAAADALVLSYCQTLFPERAPLFRKMSFESSLASQKEKTQTSKDHTLIKQRFLTPAQIACIGQTKEHYFIFLILTLARSEIHESELKKYVKTEKCSKICADLEKSHLIKNTDGSLLSLSHEMRFPETDSIQLKKIYENIDQWNIIFPLEMPFQPRLQKMMLRRVSPRYLGMLQAHCNLLIDLLRSSDEVNVDLNDEVIMLNLSLSQGNLPG